MMRKRFLSLTCVLALCLSLLPVTALAAGEHDSHSNNWTEFTAGTTTLSGGSYYLPGDVVYSGTEITVSGEVILCLNGHKLDLNKQHISVGSGASLTLCDCSTGGVLTGGSGSNGGGVYVAGGGTFTMTGGSIAGNTANAGGGVYVDEGGTFTMEDGSINNNQTTSGGGGGVMVNKGSFTLSGGSITGNTTNSDTFGYGGGVCLYGTFYLSGDSIIQNNTKAGATDNLYLGWNTIKITGPLGENARIGVTAEGVPRSFISGWSDNMAGENPADYFSSDGDAWDIGLNANGDVVLGSLCTTITLNPNGGTLPEFSLVEGAALPIPSKTGYTFAGWYENQDFTGNPVADVPTDSTGELTFYAKWTVNIYTITANASPAEGGSVTVNGSTSPVSVTAGTEVTLSATANSGYCFVGWVDQSGQSVSSDNPYTFAANSSHTLNAKFERLYTVTVGSTAGGTATGGDTYTEGDTVTLTATPNAGYRFVGWVDQSGQSVSSDNPFTFVATSDSTLTAKFEQVYTVTVNVSGNGTATADKTTAAEGETVTLTATPDSSYRFTGWTSSDGVTFANASNESTTFTMPAGDVAVTAGFTRISSGSTTYAITAPDAENGTVRVSPSRASRGTTVTITVTPDEGYELESLTVLDSRDNEITLTDKGDGKYTFTMPSGRVTVEASFAEIAPEPLPFGDVDDGDWFADAVRFVYENGMMNGVSETSFAPHATTSRSMIVTILYRLEGEPVVDDAMDFTDVAGDAYYAEAVRWAASEGIVGGYGGGLFGANDDVTREQLAAILYRYAAYQGYDVSQRADLSGFGDASSISPYAQEALSWAHAQGLVLGFEDGSLRPQGTASRAQIAAVLMRFLAAVPTA